MLSPNGLGWRSIVHYKFFNRHPDIILRPPFTADYSDANTGRLPRPRRPPPATAASPTPPAWKQLEPRVVHNFMDAGILAHDGSTILLEASIDLDENPTFLSVRALVCLMGSF